MLQTAYSLVNQYAPKTFTTAHLVKTMASNPRTILKQALSINKGAKAELTIFNTKETWEYTEKNNASRSKNSPVLNTKLTGKIIGVINKNQFLKPS
jgi:dihydroorotase